MIRWNRLKWWSALIQAIALMAALAMPAFADSAPTPSMSSSEHIALLQHYNVIRGDQSGNLNLDKSITRAEMTTIMVRAIGREKDAEYFNGAALFADSKGHWADGNLSFAKSRNLLKGDGNNYVRPNDPINYAEALTLLLRVAGKEPTTGEWPLNVVESAAIMGIMPETMLSFQNWRDPAVRGSVFVSLSKVLTTVKDASGKTLLQLNIAKDAPTNLNVVAPSVTKDAAITVTGTVQGAARVLINGKPALLRGSDFSASVDLVYGSNKLAVKAVDLAGNETNQEITVTRSGQVTRIEVTGPATVKGGESAKISAVAYDDQGNAIPGAVTASVDGTIGTYDLATGTFKAGSTSASGAIVFSAGTVTKRFSVSVGSLDPNAKSLFIEMADGGVLTAGKVGTVRVKVSDADGNLLTNDSGRTVVLSASGSLNVDITPGAIAKTDKGIATFFIKSNGTGDITLKAVSEGLPDYSRDITIGTAIRVVLTPNPRNLNANGTAIANIRAELQDQNGMPVVNNSQNDIVISVSQDDYTLGNLNGGTVVIKRGSASSVGFDLTFNAGITTGYVRFTGQVVSNHNYTVVSTGLSLYNGTVNPGGGDVVPTGSRIEILQPTQSFLPGTPERMFVRVVDSAGRPIQNGTYGFRIKATTTNGEPLVNGLPSGVSVTLGNTNLRPVDDATGVIGATQNGVAIIKFAYDKGGEVTLTPVLTNATTDARDDQGIQRTTTYTYFYAYGAKITMQQGQPTQLGLTASYSNAYNGISYSDALHAPAPKNTVISIAAQLQDSTGGAVTSDAWRIAAKLYRTTDTVNPVATADILNGRATFSITTPNVVGDTEYYVGTTFPGSNTQTRSNSIFVHTRETTLTPPTITARGWSTSGPGQVEFIRPSDTHLQFLVSGTTVANQYGVIQVYSSYGYLVYTSPVVSLNTDPLMIEVPKASITNGYSYKVRWNNGAGQSDYSAATNPVTVSLPVNYSISGAYYDYPTQTLTVTTSYASATVDATRFTFTAPNAATFTPSGGSVTANNTSTFAVTLAGSNALNDTATFSGDVRLTAAEGWLVTSAGGRAEAITTGVTVRPMVHARAAFLDGTNQKLILDTVGANSGTFDVTKISVGGVTLVGYTNNPTPDYSVAGRYQIQLTGPQWQSIITNQNNTVALSDGWYKYNTYRARGNTLTVQSRVSVNGATYNRTAGTLTVRGSGFLNVQKTNSAVTGVNPAVITLVNEGPTPRPSVTLSNTTPANVTITNDSTMVITLDAADKAKITTTDFAGNLVFMTTGNGWFTDTTSLAAPAVTGHQCGVGFIN